MRWALKHYLELQVDVPIAADVLHAFHDKLTLLEDVKHFALLILKEKVDDEAGNAAEVLEDCEFLHHFRISPKSFAAPA